MDLPVYLITGFMDSGKTSLIQQTLMENDFGVNARGLIIACEDGDEEYDEDLLASKKVSVLGVDSEEEFTAEFLKEIDNSLKPDFVFIEYNGTWEAAKIMEMKLPKGWFIAQQIATVDATTFEMYMLNMRAMMMEQVFNADLVIFNRCDENTPKPKFRANIKTINRKANILYEKADGEIDDSPEELPFDINQELIEITDADYGIWYMDVQDDPKKYDGKRVHYLAQIYRPELRFGRKPLFMPGRHAMTCCADDIQFCALKAKYDKAYEIKHKSWAWITGELKYEFAKEYKGKGPVLYVSEVVPTEEPEEKLVYFS